MKNHFKYLLPAIPVTMLLLVGCGSSDNNDIPVFNIAVAQTTPTPPATDPTPVIWYNPVPTATNATTTYTATVTPKDATNPEVQWWIANSALATLTPSGATATLAFRPGTTAPPANTYTQGGTTVRAHAIDGSFKQSNAVTVNVAIPVDVASMRDFIWVEVYAANGAYVGVGPALTHGGVLELSTNTALAGRTLAIYLSPKPWDARFKTITVTSGNTNIATVGGPYGSAMQPADYNNTASDNAYKAAYGDDWEDELEAAMEAIAFVTIPASALNHYGQTTVTITSANRTPSIFGSFIIRNSPPS